METYQSVSDARDASPIEIALNNIQESLERLANTVDRAEKVFSPVLIPTPPSPRDDAKAEVIGSTVNHRLTSFVFQIERLGGHLEELLNRSEL